MIFLSFLLGAVVTFAGRACLSGLLVLIGAGIVAQSLGRSIRDRDFFPFWAVAGVVSSALVYYTLDPPLSGQVFIGALMSSVLAQKFAKHYVRRIRDSSGEDAPIITRNRLTRTATLYALFPMLLVSISYTIGLVAAWWISLAATQCLLLIAGLWCFSLVIMSPPGAAVDLRDATRSWFQYDPSERHALGASCGPKAAWRGRMLLTAIAVFLVAAPVGKLGSLRSGLDAQRQIRLPSEHVDPELARMDGVIGEFYDVPDTPSSPARLPLAWVWLVRRLGWWAVLLPGLACFFACYFALVPVVRIHRSMSAGSPPSAFGAV